MVSPIDLSFAMNRRNFTTTLAFAAAGALLPKTPILSALLGHRLHRVHHSTVVMGQVATATLLHRDREVARQTVNALFAEFRRLEQLLSVYDPESEVAAINKVAGKQSIPVSPDFLAIVEAARRTSAASNGVLDITVEPLLRLWGFRQPFPTKPTDRQVQTALESVGMEFLHCDGGEIGLLREGASVDLGGVAVGYALDQASVILKNAGVSAALVEISGDYIAIGAPPDEPKGWEIGIVDPANLDEVLRSVFLRDQALSTSGNYASTVVYEAVNYGHIFNPDTGKPAETINSATVIAPTATLADAWSTAVFVAGHQRQLPADCLAIIV
ncbi:MAG: FAD:protein FMN transferase [Chlorobi bacterium CHB2]|nr:FAD:protein FMN transferase [Chlorobi bacterium CHB2]